ncbi:MFS transporter [Microbacterium sp. W4I20]|uniref:MFS transporter n=1 Tax=Microbacterium sp. W4I20 TaxID=3042262 RepID=UPI002787DBC4|nr:MFS transporter [Microbacterium sp. W4I20]MDQ0727074.1 MFS family permease [Microbacterium sp. W4I20]
MKQTAPIKPAVATPPRWRRDFRLFWFAQGSSVMGDQLKEFAIPLIAVSVLHVSATELGVLSAAQWLPFLVLALPLGVIVDRYRRRRLLMASELGRGALIVGLVVAAASNALAFPLLLIAVVALGALTVVYEVGHQSAIPSLVPRAELGAANSRIQATAAAGEIGGPGLGGLLLQLLGTTATLVVNAATYVVSAVALLLMSAEERPPATTERHFLAELRLGIRLVVRDPYLRANVGFSALYNPFAQWITLLLMLYAVHTLKLEAGQIGIVFSAGAAGALLGAATASRLTTRLRAGTILVLCAAVECGALLLIPVVDAGWPRVAAVAALATLMAVNGAGTAVSNVLLITIRQLRTPDRMLGRVNATMRTITYGTIPLGALLGGLVGDWLGLRMGLVVGAILCLFTVLWVWLSPLRGIRRLDDLAVAEN